MKYFSTFSGVGGFEKGIERAYTNIHKEYGVTDRQEKVLHGQPLPNTFIEPNKRQCPTCIGFSEIDKYATAIYQYHYPTHKNYGDITNINVRELPDFDLFVGGFPCFGKGTLILTKRGFIEIQHVQVGDEVFTHKKRWRKVTETHTTDSKPTRVVKGHGLIETVTTDEHPFYARRKRSVWDNEGRAYRRVPTEPGWTEAKDLKGSFVCSAMPGGGHIEGDEDFWWVVGRYVADGWLVNRRDRSDGQTCRVVICSSHHKADELEDRISRSFNYCRVDERTATKFHITNKEFAEFLKPVGRKAHNKRVPVEWMGIDRGKSKSFFEGYLSGDGHTDKHNGARRATTTSKRLAIGLSLLAQELYGVKPSITETVPPPTKEIEGRVVNQRPYYVLTIPKRNRSGFIDELGAWGMVRVSEPTGRNEVVYNIAVDEDNSYMANGVFVHNCQAFSVAGKRQGFKDTRGTLFFDVARILKAKQPEWVLLENVKGLLSHEGGKTLGTIYRVLTDIGYTVGWEVVNSCHFGVPQNRERIFIVGHLTKSGGRTGEVLPIRGSVPEIDTESGIRKYGNLSQVGQSQKGQVYESEGITPTLNAGTHGYVNGYYKVGALKKVESLDRPGYNDISNRVYSEDGIAKTLCGDGGNNNDKTGLYKVGTWRTHKDGEGFREVESGLAPTIPARAREDGSGQPVIKAVLTPDRLEKRQNGMRFKDHDEPSFTLTSQDKHGVQIDHSIRRLTPIECERLQSFPDSWTEKGMIDGKEVEISDTQRYKTLGNSVTTSVIEAIMKKIFTVHNDNKNRGLHGDN